MAKRLHQLIITLLLLPLSSSSPPPRPSFPRRLTQFGRSAGRSAGRTRENGRLHAEFSPQYETRFYTQRLDHFSFRDLPTFQQRYLLSVEHWSGAARMSPIFLYCGNEGDIEWFAENTGFVWEIAPLFGAMVVFPEHRYYGKSIPFGNREAAYKNADSLSYLTTEQALADFATLITDLKRNLSAVDCPVVLFGGSYGGMLAAWMRLKYPHIAIGALASSAPILQFENIVPSQIFYDLVSNDFKRESLSCFKTIKESWDSIETWGSKSGGLEYLSRKFGFCQTLNSAQDLSDWLSSAYSYLAMVDYPYPSAFMMPLPANPIREVCRKIDNLPSGTDVLDRIFAGISVYYNYTGDYTCFDRSDDPHGLSGWDWQACTEMVMPMSSSKDRSMFPPYDFNLSSYLEECFQSNGVWPRPRWITTEFGGLDLRTALQAFGSNIIFSNGLLDPWSGGGVLRNVSETIIAHVTDLGAHHLDLRASTKNDPNWLVEQRQFEVDIIKAWLENYYQTKQSVSMHRQQLSIQSAQNVTATGLL